ncbi:UpxY family transcription antiterminator [candidate division KSB1 bacterium]|nr:UpxY family transcription antiterminator [candidate division KSB1 bacterium]NIS25207.1 UpxY family transcription antiterminator [candidate division KSB1 bacterium]NIU25921.1 UpxY family transcription antiterminator [candidate division KSB1 bacterium]NIU89950.1 UpxY family transcription antiterminator [candidate division KSB1 bacterium]NIV97194.1 UpxY family transcription antiterminator [candidate division KSB1 bacterium]
MTSPTSDPKTERHWYALYTRPRFEKKVDEELKQKGLESLLPLRSVIRFWSDRKKKIAEPLFPSYVFVHANSKERYQSTQTDGVVRMVSFSGQPARIPEEQIQSIRRILEHGYDPEPHQYLNAGDEVEVTVGPLQGTKGYLLEQRGSSRLVISIDAIRQSVAIEVERGQIRKIGSGGDKKTKGNNFKYRLALL